MRRRFPGRDAWRFASRSRPTAPPRRRWRARRVRWEHATPSFDGRRRWFSLLWASAECVLWVEMDGLALPLLEIRRILRRNVQRIAFEHGAHRAFRVCAP